jgi:hypothetical protein
VPERAWGFDSPLSHPSDLHEVTRAKGSDNLGTESCRPSDSRREGWRGGFRDTLTAEIGPPPAGTYDAHHVFPVEFCDEFAAQGIDVNDPSYGTWIERASHQGWWYQYARDWEFLLQTEPSRSLMIDFARQLAGKYGFNVYF